MIIKRTTLFAWLLFLFAIGNTFAQNNTEANLTWHGWNEGYAKAVKENKIVLVDAYTDWCGWCKKMDRDTYSQKAIVDSINKYFIAIKFNPEITGATYMIGEQKLTPEELYGVLTQGNRNGFPSTYFIYPAQRKLFYDVGYKGPADFMEVLKSAIQESKK